MQDHRSGFLTSDVAIQIPANTATKPQHEIGVIGSPTNCVASSPAASGLTVMVLATRVGDASFQRQHPQNERQRAAGNAEINPGDPLRRA